jgi:hypothetical protein
MDLVLVRAVQPLVLEAVMVHLVVATRDLVRILVSNAVKRATGAVTAPLLVVPRMLVVEGLVQALRRDHRLTDMAMAAAQLSLLVAVAVARVGA